MKEKTIILENLQKKNLTNSQERLNLILTRNWRYETPGYRQGVSFFLIYFLTSRLEKIILILLSHGVKVRRYRFTF